ncbi:hypothetical protein APV28_2809 [Comamonas testosteroni]|nr:hypothetical protein APV28_2809 [Comamonas testosteroni]
MASLAPARVKIHAYILVKASDRRSQGLGTLAESAIRLTRRHCHLCAKQF